MAGRERAPTIRPQGFGYVCCQAAGSASAATKYCRDIELFLRRKGFGQSGVLVEDDSDGLGLDTVVAMIGNPDKTIDVLVIPSLDHLKGRLADIAPHVTVWTMYPEQWWETTDSDPLPHQVDTGRNTRSADDPLAQFQQMLLDHMTSSLVPSSPKRATWFSRR